MANLSSKDWMDLVNKAAGTTDKAKKAKEKKKQAEQKKQQNIVGNFRAADQQTIKEASKIDKVRPGLSPDAPGFVNFMYDATTPIRNLMSGNAGRLAEKTADTLLMTDRSNFGVPYTPASSPTAQKVTDVGGAILGSLAPYSGIYRGLNAAETMLPAVQRLSPLTRTGVKGGLAGGIYEGAVGIGHEETPQEIAQRMALGAGLGAVGDVALMHGLPALRQFNQTQTPRINNMDLSPAWTKVRPTVESFRAGGNRSGMLMEPQTIAPTTPTPAPTIPRLSPSQMRQGLYEGLGMKPMQQAQPQPMFSGSLRPKNPVDEAMTELQAGMEEAQNYLKHHDVLAPYPPGTTIDQAYADIKANTGIDLPALMAKVDQARQQPNFRTQMVNDIETTRLGQVAGAIPEVKGLQRNGQTRPLGQIVESYQHTQQKPLGYGRSNMLMEPETLPPQPKATDLGQTKPLNMAETKTMFKAEMPIQQQRAVQKIDEVINSVDATKLKDTTGFKAYTTDVYRVFRDVFKKDFPKVKKAILDPFDDAKKANVQYQGDVLKELRTEVVNKLGIKKGSKESALVQQYGEKQITLEELKRRSPNKWQDIVKADQWFRQKYDEMIDQVNAVRQQIYPNDAEKIIPKRKDYYRHFRDISDSIRGIHNIFDSTANIDPRLAGVSDFTTPRTKWASFAQKRLGGKFTNDAVGGFLDYVPSASYAINIDPQIPVFRELRKLLETQTLDSKNLNKFLEYLNDYANDLAGKTNPFDRNIQKIIPGGRKTFQVINWLNNRVKANMVLGNAGSALAQVANVPTGVAFAKQHAIKGAGKTMASIFKPNKDIAKSGFIQERYGGFGSKLYRQFDESLLSKPRNFAVWILEGADKIGTSFIWNSAHSKAVAEGIENPVRYADQVTRNLVAGRGIGEVPLAQKARTFQLIAPFQLEVANLWHVQKDFVSRKDFGGLVMLYLANWMFNKTMEQTRGNGVVFDPVDAIVDASKDDLTPLERGGRVAGELISNIPLGQSLTASFYPEYGFNFYGKEMPTREELFGENDPTRFGSGVILAKGLQNPGTMMAMPFGGKQAEKTWQGIQSINKGGVYTQDGDKLKYPIDQNAVNELKGLLFGPSAFNEARDYYDNENRPLTEKQTKEVNESPNTKAAYQDTQKQRKINSLKRKISDTKNDEDLTDQEKDKQIKQYEAELNKLNGGK